MDVPLQKLTLAELAQKFTKKDQFIFEQYEDGMFQYACYHAELLKFPATITFFPSPYAKLYDGADIDGLCAAIDSSRFFSLKIHL